MNRIFEIPPEVKNYVINYFIKQIDILRILTYFKRRLKNKNCNIDVIDYLIKK